MSTPENIGSYPTRPTHPDIIDDIEYDTESEASYKKLAVVPVKQVVKNPYDGNKIIAAESEKALAVLTAMENYDADNDASALVRKLGQLTEGYRYIIGKKGTLSRLDRDIKIAFPRTKPVDLPAHTKEELMGLTNEMSILQQKRDAIETAPHRAKSLNEPYERQDLLKRAFTDGADELQYLHDLKADLLVQMANIPKKKGIKLSTFAIVAGAKITTESSVREISPYLNQGFDTIDQDDYHQLHVEAVAVEETATQLVDLLRAAKDTLAKPISYDLMTEYVQETTMIYQLLQQTTSGRINRELELLSARKKVLSSLSKDNSRPSESAMKDAQSRIKSQIQEIRSQVRIFLRHRGYNNI